MLRLKRRRCRNIRTFGRYVEVAGEKELKALSSSLSAIFAAVAGLSFLFGGGVIHAVASVGRFLAEILGIAIAFVCLIGIVITKHVIDDIAWKEANEEAAMSGTKPNS